MKNLKNYKILAIVLTSVFFLSSCGVGEKVKNIQDGVRMASDTLLSGKTKQLIENLKVAKTSLQ